MIALNHVGVIHKILDQARGFDVSTKAWILAVFAVVCVAEDNSVQQIGGRHKRICERKPWGGLLKLAIQ